MNPLLERLIPLRFRSRPEPDSAAVPELVSDLLRLASELTVESSFDHRMERVCEATRRLLHCDRCSIFLLDDGLYRARFNAGNPPDVAKRFLNHSVSPNEPLIQRAIRSRRQVTVNDTSRSPLMNQTTAKRARIHSIVVAPIFEENGSPRGFITAEFNENPRDFLAAESELFDGVSKIVSLAIDQHEAREKGAQIEARLAAAAKLESLGRFAGGIAHDFNSRLTVILGIAEQVTEKLRTTAYEADLEELLRAAEAAAALTQKLLEFSDGNPAGHERANSSSVVRDLHGLVRRFIPADIELTMRVLEDDLFVGCSTHDFERIVTNLIANAVDACEEGDEIGVSLCSIDLTEEALARSAPHSAENDLEIGRHVRLTVRDTGVGIGSSDIERIFDPFFSNKRCSQGAGLGLASVYGLVRAAGGRINVESEAGVGTRFVVLLPIVSRRDHENLDARPTPVVSDTTGSILLVDDDESVRRFVRGMLEKQGHRVMEAVNGRHALEVIASAATPIDLLVTDYVMPEMGGADLANALRETHPDLAVLFVSGYAPDFRSADGTRPADAAFLPKPFSTARLLEEVDGCLARLGSLN